MILPLGGGNSNDYILIKQPIQFQQNLKLGLKWLIVELYLYKDCKAYVCSKFQTSITSKSSHIWIHTQTLKIFYFYYSTRELYVKCFHIMIFLCKTWVLENKNYI